MLEEIVVFDVSDDDIESFEPSESVHLFDVFVKVLHFLFCDIRQSDINRLAAIVKRCGGVAVHGGLKETLGSLSMIYKLLIKHQKLRRLVEFEGQGELRKLLYIYLQNFLL
eukprot:TRINITY_DN26302_c1_g1_i1.p2 TRINITY_DN26302_c1_g1~~TRINITY_DN26302_c1_g1_i1.p2  ORF type:complete len:130 (-),score=22.26 TRINITY_DN26302_c1_g1_i1:35-367(-)